MSDGAEKREDIAAVIAMLQRLSPVQVDIIEAIISRFADEQSVSSRVPTS